VPIKYLICLLIPLLLVCGCGSTYQKSENLRFGVDVAKKGLWKEAVSRWEKVLELDPSNALAYNNLAVAYEEAGEYERAEEAYQKALQIDGTQEWILENYRNFKEFYTGYLEEQEKKEIEEDESSTEQE